MAGITEAVVEEIKARVDLAELIASYGVQVRVAGASKKACCPFHHEKTPSFNINDTRGFYHCFGCGESGDAIKFVQKMDGLTFVEAVKKLAAQCGVEIKEREDPAAGRRRRLLALLAELAQFYHRCLKQTKEGALAREYLAKRDLGDAVQEAYLIGYAPSGVANVLKWAEKHRYSPEELEAAGVIKAPNRPGDSGYHRFGGRLMFTIRDKQGRVVGFSGRQLVASKNSGKYVNSPETEVFKKSNVLYGFDKAAGAITKSANREAIVCEGQIDCIRLQTCGFPNAVAGQGTAFTEEHVRMLRRVADQVALVYDDDGAGHKATIKSARLCLAAELPVRVVSLPGGDDPDSFLRAHPADDFRAMLDNAESIMSFQVRAERAKEARPDTVDAVSRITREILLTIAACPSAVLRASMVGEAAKLMHLPAAALAEELGKVVQGSMVSKGGRVANVASVASGMREGGEEDFEVDDGQYPKDPKDSKDLTDPALPPPSPKEIAFCAFLMSCEYAEEVKKLDDIVGEFLPPPVFGHDFTRTFVESWRAEVAQGRDVIGPWSQTLGPSERGWFDQVLLGQEKSLGSSLAPDDLLQDFVRSLWIARLTRLRGDLPSSGDAAADVRRLKISMDLKRLNAVKWNTVKDLIRDWIKGEN